MNIALLSFPEQTILVLATLILLMSFLLLSQSRLTSAVYIFAWQGVCISVVTALIGYVHHNHHLYVSALITLALKGYFIPWLMHKMIRRIKLEKHIDHPDHPVLLLLAATGLVIFSYWISIPIQQAHLANISKLIALSIALILIGFFIMTMRKQAVLQVIGFMSIENGLFLSAISTSEGMPLLIELGVAFDVLVAAVLFGVFFLQIYDSIESLDVDQLNHLAEKEDR
jgi:hydrogenase-4 component E